MANVKISGFPVPFALPSAAALNGSEVFPADQTVSGFAKTVGVTVTQLATYLGSSGGFLSSVVGTANEIAVSTSAGVATVSFAQNIIVPAPSSGVALTVTGLTNGNALLVQSAGTSSVQQYINNQTAGGQAILGFQIAGTVNGYIGSAGTAGQLAVDSAAGDMVLRTQGGNFRVTTNSGTSTALEVNAAGALSMGGNNTSAEFGDITAGRSATTGALYLGSNGTKYLYFDGTSYQFGGGAPVTTNGGLITAGGITVTTNTWNVDSGGQKRFYWASTGDSYFEIGGGSFHWRNSSDSDLVTLSNAGNFVIDAPTSGTAFTATAATSNAAGLFIGASSASTLVLDASTTTNASFGLLVRSGTTANDYCVQFQNASAATTFFEIFGDGGVVVGSPTGGDKGAGTINATGLYVNGVAVGGGVTQTTGTFTGTLTGCTTSPTATFNYVIIGKLAIVYNQTALTATSNSAGCTVTGMPAALEPANTVGGVINVQDSGTAIAGSFNVSPGSTTITLSAGTTGSGGFATTLSKGLAAGTVMVWSLN